MAIISGRGTSVNNALQAGRRGLRGGSSLARLLAKHRGVRNRKGLPPYTEDQILKWADACFQRSGSWPWSKSGPIPDAPGETWMAVDMALAHGTRGLAGGSSLALLLAERRNVRNKWTMQRLTVERILSWADAHYALTGHWPTKSSGAIPESPGDDWSTIEAALSKGARGLPGGLSLAQVLAIERDVRNRANLARLKASDILKWADAFYRRTGAWPTRLSGVIPESRGDTWLRVELALRKGGRGLRRHGSLARFLAKHGRKQHLHEQPALTIKQILAWADNHFMRTGRWPTTNQEPTTEAPKLTWKSIDTYLRSGRRGLRGGSSLFKLLVKKRGLRKQPHSTANRDREAGPN